MNFSKWCDTQFIKGNDRQLFRTWLEQNELTVELKRDNSEWWKLWRRFIEAELVAAGRMQKNQ